MPTRTYTPLAPQKPVRPIRVALCRACGAVDTGITVTRTARLTLYRCVCGEVAAYGAADGRRRPWPVDPLDVDAPAAQNPLDTDAPNG